MAFQAFHLPVCDPEWLMGPPLLHFTKLRHSISLSSWIIPQCRGWMRLTGDAADFGAVPQRGCLCE